MVSKTSWGKQLSAVYFFNRTFIDICKCALRFYVVATIEPYVAFINIVQGAAFGFSMH